MHQTFVYLLFVTIVTCESGRTHYYGGPGYPTTDGAYNPYYNHYGVDNYGYDGYENYGGYGDLDYDGYNAHRGYGGYYQPYAYQKQWIPAKYVNSPVVPEYVEPLPAISKSVSTSSLYQTHPSPYDYHGYGNSYGNGYGNGYGYAPKYGSQYENYYKK